MKWNPLNRSVRVVAAHSPYTDSIDLFVMREDYHARPVPVETLTFDPESEHFVFEKIEEGNLPNHAPLRLVKHAAQRLMDDLYRAGLRPVDGKATDGQLAALEAHLADMRLSYTTLLARAQR